MRIIWFEEAWDGAERSGIPAVFGNAGMLGLRYASSQPTNSNSVGARFIAPLQISIGVDRGV